MIIVFKGHENHVDLLRIVSEVTLLYSDSRTDNVVRLRSSGNSFSVSVISLKFLKAVKDIFVMYVIQFQKFESNDFK